MISLPIINAQRPPPAPSDAGDGPLRDAHGRVIRDVRIGVTDRCNFRCVYCLEPGARFMPSTDLLTPQEIIRLAQLLVGLGVRRIRITGGEPTVRHELDAIIAGVAATRPDDLAITTNGSAVDRQRVGHWKAIGLNRVTLSLDSLRPERFSQMTRATTPVETVIDAIRAARDAGLAPVRVNAVIVRGFNDDEVADLADLARQLSVEMRFIEFMPLDDARQWDRTTLVTADEIIESIRARHDITPTGRESRSSTSTRFVFADGSPGGIGIIAPVTRPFCGECSRLRITADGKVRPCLFSTNEWDLRSVLRTGQDDDAVRAFLRDATWTKQAGHAISTRTFVQPDRSMSSIGG